MAERNQKLNAFGPEHLREEAEQSGFFHCRECGMFWFGRPDASTCPDAEHGRPVQVALLCRTCDIAVPLADIVEHLSDRDHLLGMAD
jgi:hypothetical protein